MCLEIIVRTYRKGGPGTRKGRVVPVFGMSRTCLGRGFVQNTNKRIVNSGRVMVEVERIFRW